MPYTFSPDNLAEDWQRVKAAHTAAVEMAALQSMLCPGSAAPFGEYLYSMAKGFESVHKIAFDPTTMPLPAYEGVHEAMDFDASVDAHNACLVGA